MRDQTGLRPSLLDPLDREIADHEAASAWLSRRADIIDIRSRQ